MANESKCSNCKIFIIYFTYWNSNTNLPQATLLEMKDLSNCSRSPITNIVAETCITYKNFLDHSIPNSKKLLDNVEKLKTHKDSPKQYISQWKLLHNWLKDPLLKIQVKYLVKFSKAIYEPIMNFLAEFDSTPRILRILKKNIDGLTSGVEVALDSLKKWLGIWSYFKSIIESQSYNKEECYIKELENEIDMKPELQNFGLHEALENPEFFNEFIEFASSKTEPQIEGLFNKYDLKCYLYITEEIKKSNLCLATANVKDITFSKKDLSTARNQINNVTSNLLEDSNTI
ncbi:hypothetical protein C2G38_2181823 [Gigaspora rosea]|uniref:Uncharacterized protein n=1 Tax=Gigaspora rosea TaxID=44941 RepID=A0A397VCK2_9GLOM|nr:hypothetical protein C2G38_2181823 [Gigaspora rosea]